MENDKAVARAFRAYPELTDRHKEFLRLMLLGGLSPERAGEAAGFGSGGHFSVLRTPAVAAALHEAVQAGLQADAPASLAVLRSIRDDEKAPAGVRSEIALKLLRLAGHVEPTKADSTGDHRALSEMTSEELRQFIERNQVEVDRLEGELAARAKPVSAPVVAPKESDVTPNFME